MPDSVLNILICEDDALQSRLMQKRFQKFAGRYKVHTVKTLAEAAEILSKEKIDVIVSDIFLPDGKGTEMIYKYPDIPVIAITARGDEKLAVQIMKAGAVDYILKDSEEFNNLPKMVDNALAAWDSSEKDPNSSRLQYNMPTILDAMPDGVVVVDVNGEIVYSNAGAERILDLKRDSILGSYYFEEKWQNVDERGKPISEKELPLYLALKEQKKVDHFEHGLARPAENGTKWISVNATPIYDNGNSLIGALATFRDITATKELQREIKKERRFISAIENASDTLLVLLDYEGKIIRFNSTCEKTTGFLYDDIKDKPFWDYLILEEEKNEVRRIFNELREKAQSNQFQNYWKTRDGKKRFITWTNTTVRDENGNFEYILGTGIDITERKQEEEQRLQELQHEIAGLTQFAFRNTTSVTAGTYGQKPLAAANPDAFEKSVETFLQILDNQIEEMTYRTGPDEIGNIRMLGEELGLLKAKPKDIIDIYTAVLSQIAKEKDPARTKVYKDEGRLLVLELMGHLASFYRKYYTGTIDEERV